MTDMGKSVLLFCVGVAGMLIQGVALSFMWAWFIVPLGVPPVETAHAIGISLVAAFLTHQMDYGRVREKEIGDLISEALFGPVLILGIAWLVHVAMVG